MTSQPNLGYSVKIFVPDGDPDGLRFIEKTNWSGSGVTYPRALANKAAGLPELDRAGVYVLVGPDDDAQLPRIYIGQGDPVSGRISAHRERDFWTWAVAFTSKDQSLNKAHVQHLEASLYHLAVDAKRCALDNDQTPGKPTLSDADTAEVDAFLADVMLCLPILGLSVFESAKTPASPTDSLVLTAGGIEAAGHESPQGFVVREGGGAVETEVASAPAYLTQRRRALIKSGVMREVDGGYALTQDYVFSSPSLAAAVLLGRTANGRIEWKTEDGRSLKDIQDAERSEA